MTFGESHCIIEIIYLIYVFLIVAVNSNNHPQEINKGRVFRFFLRMITGNMNSEIIFLFMYDTGSIFEIEQLNGLLKNQEDFSKFEFKKPGPEEIATFNVPIIFNLKDEILLIDNTRYLFKVQVSIYKFGGFSIRIRYIFSGTYEQLLKLTFDKRINNFVNNIVVKAKKKIVIALRKITKVKENDLSERYRFYYIDGDKQLLLQNHMNLIAGLLIDEEDISTLEKEYVELVLKKNITYDNTSIFFVGWESAIIIDKDYIYEHELLMAEIANLELLETRIQHKRLVDKLKDANNQIEKLEKDKISFLSIGGLRKLNESLGRSYDTSKTILNNVEDTAYGYGEWYLSRVYALFYDVFKLNNIESMLEKDMESIDNERKFVNDMIEARHENFLEYIVILLIAIEIIIELFYFMKL